MTYAKIISQKEHDAIFESWGKFLNETFSDSVSTFLDFFYNSNPNLNSFLFMPKGISLVDIIRKIELLMLVENYIIHNELLRINSVRSSKIETYVLLHSGNEEGDKEFRGYSYEEIKNRGVLGMTLEERLMTGFKYFIESGGRHLDNETITLCNGSETYLGGIPSVEWQKDKLVINIHHNIHKDPRMGIRLVEPVKCIFVR
ncbi:MAG: hypothetical protein QMD65_00450 [Patescibacteria group bacterium]|nr:hypothetical protein [Patescibacteria group bacterium]